MDVLLDSTGDLYLGDDGRMDLTSSTAEVVKQRLELRLDSQRGSWFLDETWGVRYIDMGDNDAATILVKNPNIIAIVSELKAIITSIEGVERITSFTQQFVPATRSFDITFTVTTEDDDVVGVVHIGDSEDALFDPDGSAIALFELTVRSVCPV